MTKAKLCNLEVTLKKVTDFLRSDDDDDLNKGNLEMVMFLS